MLWSFTIATDTDDNIFSSIVNESRNRKARDEAWSYFCDASMFQYAFSTMTLSLSVYLAVLCAILSVKRRRLRRTGRKAARGCYLLNMDGTVQVHRYLRVQSLSPPYRPLYLVLGSIQQCSPREYLIEINYRWKGPIAVRVRLHMASGVTQREKIQHGVSWLLQFSAAIRSRFPPKRLQAGSANVDKESSVAI